MTSLPSSVTVILADVANLHGVSVADLRGERRTRKLSAARFEAYERLRAMRFGRGLFDHPSLPQIGAWLNRHHASVLHGLRARAAGNGASLDA